MINDCSTRIGKKANQPVILSLQHIHMQLVTGGFQPGAIRQEQERVAFEVPIPGQFTVEISALVPRP